MIIKVFDNDEDGAAKDIDASNLNNMLQSHFVSNILNLISRIREQQGIDCEYKVMGILFKDEEEKIEIEIYEHKSDSIINVIFPYEALFIDNNVDIIISKIEKEGFDSLVENLYKKIFNEDILDDEMFKNDNYEVNIKLTSDDDRLNNQLETLLTRVLKKSREFDNGIDSEKSEKEFAKEFEEIIGGVIKDNDNGGDNARVLENVYNIYMNVVFNEYTGDEIEEDESILLFEQMMVEEVYSHITREFFIKEFIDDKMKAYLTGYEEGKDEGYMLAVKHIADNNALAKTLETEEEIEETINEGLRIFVNGFKAGIDFGLDKADEYNNRKEVCVICGKETEELVNSPLDIRFSYIHGTGQLCQFCHDNIVANN